MDPAGWQRWITSSRACTGWIRVHPACDPCLSVLNFRAENGVIFLCGSWFFSIADCGLRIDFDVRCSMFEVRSLRLPQDSLRHTVTSGVSLMTMPSSLSLSRARRPPSTVPHWAASRWRTSAATAASGLVSASAPGRTSSTGRPAWRRQLPVALPGAKLPSASRRFTSRMKSKRTPTPPRCSGRRPGPPRSRAGSGHRSATSRSRRAAGLSARGCRRIRGTAPATPGRSAGRPR